MRRVTVWTCLGAFVGLGIAVLAMIPPTFPSAFWEWFIRVAPFATKPAAIAYQEWQRLIPLPEGQYFSAIRMVTVIVLQWGVSGFLVGLAAFLSCRRKMRAEPSAAANAG